jgi:hypothetical protein
MLGIDERFRPPANFASALDELHVLAAHEAGSDDFGTDDYRIGLRVLLESMDYDARFSDRGRLIAWGSLVNTLAGRARAVHAMKSLPGLDRMQINQPIVITGLHRTGTTALHKLLSVDPQFQGLQSWLTASPMPRPPRDTWEGNPQFQAVVRQLEARFASAPGLRAAHAMAAEEVDECGGILCQGFVSIVWMVAWSAASYDAWWQTQSERPAYLYFRRVLQLIGSSAASQRWLLKHPPHIAKLGILLETFPDARVIQTHRDPAKAIPSLCSLVMKNHDLMEIGRRDQRARLMGYRMTAMAAKALRDAEPVRQRHRHQIMDVDHSQFHRDPIGVIRRIYPFIGLELSAATEAIMRQRIASAPEAAHGSHRYAASDFGLSEDEIRAQFGDYIDRFNLRPVRVAQEGA